jgi:predicted Zn-dependent peptidase
MDLPPTFGETRREIVPDDVVLSRVMLAFRIPPFGSPEHYAAGLCAAVLGLRQGSRLYQTLVREQQVASEVGAFTYDLSKGSDLLVVDAVARPEIDAPTLEGALVAEIDRLREHGVTEDELARARALIESGFVLALQSAGERADQLSRFTTYFDDPHRVNEEPARYRAVTAEQVSAFARARLGPDNRAFLIFVPKEPSADDGDGAMEDATAAVAHETAAALATAGMTGSEVRGAEATAADLTGAPTARAEGAA